MGDTGGLGVMDVYEAVARRTVGAGADIEAFAATLEEHRSRLAASIRRSWYPGQPVEDIVQETFTRALRARTEYDSTRPLMPWLLRIARNIVIDQYRREHAAIEPLENGGEPVDAGDGPERSYVRDEQIRQMREALALLPERHRTMLERHCEGDSYALLAIGDGVTVASMKSLLNRARNMLRDAYLDLTDDSTWGLAPAMLRVRSRCRRALGRISDPLGRLASSAPASVAIGWLAASVVATIVVGSASPVQMAAARSAASMAVVVGVPNSEGHVPDAIPHGAAHATSTSPIVHSLPAHAARVDWSVDHTHGSRDVTMAHITIVPGVGPTDQTSMDIPCEGTITGAIACRVLTHVW